MQLELTRIELVAIESLGAEASIRIYFDLSMGEHVAHDLWVDVLCFEPFECTLPNTSAGPYGGHWNHQSFSAVASSYFRLCVDRLGGEMRFRSNLSMYGNRFFKRVGAVLRGVA